MDFMILVTGAAGKTGKALMRELLERGRYVRALVHTQRQVEQLKTLGVQEAPAGDMRSHDEIMHAFKDIRSVYHIPPNVSPDEITIGKNVIAGAQSAGVEHFVYHSVLHPQVEAMPHHWAKMRVEEQVFESGLPFTILQPAVYMQNILAYWDEIAGEGIYRVPYPAHTRLSFVDLDNVAEAGAAVLSESGHDGAVYELCGADNLSVKETAQMIGRCLGNKVEIERIPIDRWERLARENGLGDYQVNALIAMFHYYERFGFTGNPTVLECLLKSPATRFETFIERLISKRS